MNQPAIGPEATYPDRVAAFFADREPCGLNAALSYATQKSALLMRSEHKLIRYQSPTAGGGWTLHEAVACLATHGDVDPTWVLGRVHAHNREGKEGWLLAWAKLAASLARGDEDQFALIDAVREQLRSSCEAGLVHATGVPMDRGNRKLIDPIEFVGAEIWHGEGTRLHRIVAGVAEPARWLELRFDSKDVQALASSSSQQGKKTRRSQFDREAFISQAVELMLDEGGFGADFTQAQLHDRMEVWCNARWPKAPSRSWMYERFNEVEIRYRDRLSNLA